MFKRILLLGLFHAAAVLAGEAAGQRQAEAHLHGQALLNIVVDGSSIGVELESAAVNLLGFERLPESAEEQLIQESVTRRLQDHAVLLEFSKGNCTQMAASSQFPDFGQQHQGEGASEHAEDAHEHAHDESAAQPSQHADILLYYQLDCRPSQGLEVRLTAFAEFPGITEVVVQWINDSGQGRAVLSPQRPTFRME